MKIEQKHLDTCELQLVIEVEPDRVEQAKRIAARRLARRVNIPGFRKGKAPYKVALSQLGEGRIMEQVLDDVGQKVYQEALETIKVTAVAPGEIVDASFDPLRLTFNVSLAPEVDMGDYRDTRLEYTPVSEVTDEAVSEALESIRQQHALLEPVERPAQEGDVVRVDVLGMLGDQGEEPEELIDEKDTEVLVGEDVDWPMPGFTQQLIGIRSDDTYTFDLGFPDNYVNTSLAGQIVHFTVKCRGIKSRTLPELDDNFAMLVDGDHETILELRIAIREQLQHAANARQETEYQQKVVDAVVSGASVSFPNIILANQIDDMLRERDLALRRKGLTLQDHLKIEGTSEEQLREELVPEATERVQRALVLGKVVEEEGLKVEELAIEERISASAKAFGDAADQVRSALDNDHGRRTIRNDLLVEMAVEKLVAITKGDSNELHGTATKSIPESGDNPSTVDNSGEAEDTLDPTN